MKNMIKNVVMVLSLGVLLIGCSSNQSPNQTTDVEIDDIVTAVQEVYGEDYLPSMEIEAEMLEIEFGLTADMIDEVRAQNPMMSTHADRVVIVKAAQGQADAVEAALEAARESKISDSLQYPMNLAKINATKVVRHGDYVCFLLVGAIDDSGETDEAAQKEFAEAEVQKAVDAIADLFK